MDQERRAAIQAVVAAGTALLIPHEVGAGMLDGIKHLGPIIAPRHEPSFAEGDQLLSVPDGKYVLRMVNPRRWDGKYVPILWQHMHVGDVVRIMTFQDGSLFDDGLQLVVTAPDMSKPCWPVGVESYESSKMAARTPPAAV